MISPVAPTDIATGNRSKAAEGDRPVGLADVFRERFTGDLDTFRPFGPWSLAGVDLDLLEHLRKTARRAGAKIRNKTQITDLLTDDGRVVGAVGFDILDGSSS